MSSQETREARQARQRRQARGARDAIEFRKKGRVEYSAGPTFEARRQEKWSDDFLGEEELHDDEYFQGHELDFHQGE